MTTLRPVSARSALLSMLLGAHPPTLSARALVSAVGLVGIAESAARAALSRMVAAGDLDRADGLYTLAPRLLARQRRQDAAITPETLPWNGDWETAVITTTGRDPAARATLRADLTTLRLAELREGIWLRPANLARPWPAALTQPAARPRSAAPVPSAEAAHSQSAHSQSVDPAEPRSAEPRSADAHSKSVDLAHVEPADHPVTRFTARPAEDPALLAATLWDLDAWAAQARALIAAATTTDEPARFAAVAMSVRHLTADPVLPPDLLPPDWPGPSLRATYADYRSWLASVAGEDWADRVG